MSIVNRVIIIPENVQVILEKKRIKIIGPKGELSREIIPQVNVIKEGNKIFTKLGEGNKLEQVGTINALILNAIKGTSELHQKKLNIEGTGYKVLSTQKGELEFSLGLSHNVKIDVPIDLKVEVVNNNKGLVIEGIDKEKVGDFAAKIKDLRQPNAYKLRGIYYHSDSGEVIKLKTGKSGVNK